MVGPTKIARGAGTGASVPVEQCQICGSEKLDYVLSLGYMPPVNQMVPIGQVPRQQPWFPTDLLHCRHCDLVQLGLAVDLRALEPLQGAPHPLEVEGLIAGVIKLDPLAPGPVLRTPQLGDHQVTLLQIDEARLGLSDARRQGQRSPEPDQSERANPGARAARETTVAQRLVQEGVTSERSASLWQRANASPPGSDPDPAARSSPVAMLASPRIRDPLARSRRLRS